MLGDALYYPTRGENAVMTILIGGVLTLLSFLLVPIFFVFGYFVRVLEQTVNGEDEPPAFSEWGDLGMKGLMAFIITLVYYAIPILAFAGLGGIGAVTGSENVAIASLSIAIVVGGVLFIALTYVYPAALTNFAKTGQLGQAFAFGDISEVVLSGDYLVAWLVGFLIFVGGFVVVGMLSIIPLLGTLVGLFVNFYIQVAAYRVFGFAFRRATGAGGSGSFTTTSA